MATPFIVSITIDAVIDALATLIAPFVAGAEIVRAQQNLVAPPAGPYVQLTEILRSGLETPSTTTDGGNEQSVIQSKMRLDVQADFYGPDAGEWCAAIESVFRTPYAAANFPDGIAPLYCTDGHKHPLLSGEQQYVCRWTITASLQYNPSLSVPQPSATVLKLNVRPPL